MNETTDYSDNTQNSYFSDLDNILFENDAYNKVYNNYSVLNENFNTPPESQLDIPFNDMAHNRYEYQQKLNISTENNHSDIDYKNKYINIKAEFDNLKTQYENLKQWYDNVITQNNYLNNSLYSKNIEINKLNSQILSTQIKSESNDKVEQDNKLKPTLEEQDNNCGTALFDDDWWNGINLDKVELEARAKLNNEQTQIINKLRKKLNKTRGYSKRLLRKYKILLDKQPKKDSVDIFKVFSFKEKYNKTSEHLFRNKCMNIVYGSIPSISLWTSNDTLKFDITYWNSWTEEQCKKIINTLYTEYWEYYDLIILLNNNFKRNSKTTPYKHTLKTLVEWLYI